MIVAWVVCSPPDAWVRSGWLASAVWEISLWMPWIPGSSVAFRVGVLAVWVSLAFLLLFASGQQALLRVLLSDKSFLYQARSPTALLKAWFVAVRCLTRGKPHIYSFQACGGGLRHVSAHAHAPPSLLLQRALPHLPVPPLAETVRRYLESAKQLQTPEEFEGTAATAAAFLAKEGPTLQWYLQLKSWFFDNYVWVGGRDTGTVLVAHFNGILAFPLPICHRPPQDGLVGAVRLPQGPLAHRCQLGKEVEEGS